MSICLISSFRCQDVNRMTSGRGKTRQTAWNSLRAANWSKNEGDEQAKQSGGSWLTPILYSMLIGRKRDGKEQTATRSRWIHTWWNFRRFGTKLTNLQGDVLC